MVSKLLSAGKGGYVDKKVQSIIQKDLERFRDLAQELYNKGQ